MDNKEKDIIDELLKDYSRQKEAHESNFGEISKEPASFDNLPAPPKRAELHNTKKDSNRIISKKEKKPKEKREKKKKERRPVNKAKLKAVLKKLFITLVSLAAAAGLVFGAISIFNYAQSAYLKPYREKYPDIEFPKGIEEHHCDYYGSNPGTAGYIQIEDIGLQEYVLSDSNGKNPVLDKTNSRGSLDFNTVVYLTGENSLEKTYSTANGYLNSTQKITYSTLLEDYSFNVIGAYYTNSKPEDDKGYVFPYNLTKSMTAESLDAFTDRLYHKFIYNSDYYLSNSVITSQSKLITVCAKTSFMPDFYFVVVGILNGEKVETAQDNANIYYPQIWFDKNKKENSFRFAGKWYPEIYINEEETSKQNESDFTKF